MIIGRNFLNICKIFLIIIIRSQSRYINDILRIHRFCIKLKINETFSQSCPSYFLLTVCILSFLFRYFTLQFHQGLVSMEAFVPWLVLALALFGFCGRCSGNINICSIVTGTGRTVPDATYQNLTENGQTNVPKYSTF